MKLKINWLRAFICLFLPMPFSVLLMIFTDNFYYLAAGGFLIGFLVSFAFVSKYPVITFK